jgi:ornithine cyclodeaminase
VTELLMLSAVDVERFFRLELAIESQRAAFTALGAGTAVLPPRLLVPGTDDSVAFCYAARLTPDGGAVAKFGSVNPRNASRGLPTVSAVVTVLDPVDGHPVAVLDGTAVTTLRTAAASAVAASALARSGARTLTVLGSGVQARAHVPALAHVLPGLAEVRLWSPSRARREALAESLSGAGAEQAAGVPSGCAVTAASCAEDAVRGADVVACCTTSLTPVLDDGWLAQGTLVISVGSFAPDRHEVPASLVSSADLVVVDDVPATLADCGPVMAAIAAGAFAETHLVSLGQVVTGQHPGRRSPADVIYYNSVGLGIQDAAAALAIVAAA